MRGAAVLLVALISSVTLGQERPLPDKDTLAREVRKRLHIDDALQANYSYVETRRDQKLDADGRVVTESVRVIESYPGFPGEERWERVISTDGKLTPPAELARQERVRDQQAREYARDMARQSSADRARQEREWEEQRRELADMTDDAFRAFDFNLIRRESVGGHSTIVVTMTPRPEAKLKTRIGKLLRSFHGRAWVSESEYELVKLEVEALDDASIGWGLVARIHKGTRMSFERRKINNTVWLPVRTTYAASARVLLLRRLNVGRISEYSNYKRRDTETAGP